MRYIIVTLMVVSSACSHVALTPQGKRVMVAQNPNMVTGCKLLGRVTAEGDVQFNVVTSLRNAAGAQYDAADTLSWEMSRQGFSDFELTGNVYACRVQP